MKVVSFDIRIACDHCGAVGKLPHTSVNRLVQCSNCGRTFRAVPDGEVIKPEPTFSAVTVVKKKFVIEMMCSEQFKKYRVTFAPRGNPEAFCFEKAEIEADSNAQCEVQAVVTEKFSWGDLDRIGSYCPYCGDRGYRSCDCGRFSCDGGIKQPLGTKWEGLEEWLLVCPWCRKAMHAVYGKTKSRKEVEGAIVETHAPASISSTPAYVIPQHRQIEAPKSVGLIRKIFGGR